MTRANPANNGKGRQTIPQPYFRRERTGPSAIQSSGLSDQQLDELSHFIILTINHAFDSRGKTAPSIPAASKFSTTGETSTSTAPAAHFTPGQIEILSQLVLLAVHNSLDERQQMTAPYQGAGIGFTDQQLEEICDLISLTVNDALDDRAKGGFSPQQIDALHQIVHLIVMDAFETHELNQGKKRFARAQIDEISKIVQRIIDGALDERAGDKFHQDVVCIDKTGFSSKQLDQISHILTSTVNQAVDRAFEERFGPAQDTFQNYMKVGARHTLNFVNRVNTFMGGANPLKAQPEKETRSHSSTSSIHKDATTNTAPKFRTERILAGKLDKFINGINAIDFDRVFGSNTGRIKPSSSESAKIEAKENKTVTWLGKPLDLISQSTRVIMGTWMEKAPLNEPGDCQAEVTEMEKLQASCGSGP